MVAPVKKICYYFLVAGLNSYHYVLFAYYSMSTRKNVFCKRATRGTMAMVKRSKHVSSCRTFNVPAYG